MTGPACCRAAEIAEETGLSIRTIRRRLADGTIPSIKLGGARLIDRALAWQRLAPPLNLDQKDEDDH